MFSSMETSNSTPFFLSGPTSSALGLHGQVVIPLTSQWRLSARASQVYSRTDIVCSPPTLFSKKDLHVHHFCESEAFFWHIVHGPAYQQTTHRK